MKLDRMITGLLVLFVVMYCNGVSARFVSSDPIGLAGGTNTYAYVNNNPVNWVDPSGLVNVNPNVINTDSWGGPGGVGGGGGSIAGAAGLGGAARGIAPQRLLPSPQTAGPHYPPNDGFLGKPAPFTLLPGTKIDRFGGLGGRYVSPEGVPFGQRSIPYCPSDYAYRNFEIQKPLTVEAGQAVPWFGQPGLGEQYFLPSPIGSLIEQGYVK